MPRVSICLPNLNHCRFLEERLATIYAQTFADWELVVYDSHSDDGSWELLQRHAARDSRIHLHQDDRQGPYPSWNRCVAAARGEFVYFATSDDTMMPGCLAALAAALDAHPHCNLAECCLHGIDEHGQILPGWWRTTGAALSLGEDYLRPHIRRAPYDGVLHAGMHTIYTSITQLLIRRRTFDITGPFPIHFGPSGDFCWGMKAGLTCDLVHVPQFLATWRIHSGQASGGHHQTIEERALMNRMVNEALAACNPSSPAARLPAASLRFPYRLDYYRMRYAEAKAPAQRLRVIWDILREPSFAWRALLLLVSGKRREFRRKEYLLALLRRYGLESCFQRLPRPATLAP